jgi:D-arginine dehydrogenase
VNERAKTACDVLIIGAGMAGAGLAAALPAGLRVTLIEAEATPGFHATGRSAAFWHETLGGPHVRALTRASHGALEAGGFLTARKSFEVAEADDLAKLEALEAQFTGTGVRLDRVDRAGLLELVPRAAPVLVGGLVEVDGADIDVAGVHGAALGQARRNGANLITGARVDRIVRSDGRWRVEAGGRVFDADVLVDAAGAWADTIARMAGVAPLGIVPKRRTMVQVRVDSADVPADLPLVMDIAGRYYFRPVDAQRLWLCPHDETPVEPHDVAPEEIDVATAIHQFERVTDWRVAAVERKWAGLRSFAPDRLPVIGFDATIPDFFWLAGQGGVGIQTAPAASALAAALVMRRDADIPGVEPTRYDPARFAAI